MIGSALASLSDSRAKWIKGGHPQDPTIAKILALQEKTASGITINRQTALSYPAVWRGVNLISGDVGKLPLYVYKRTKGGGKERAKRHPATKLLRRRPHPRYTSSEMKRTMTAHALLEGNGYCWVGLRGDGVPIDLTILLPDRTFPVIVNGKYWIVTTIQEKQRRLDPRRVMHIHGLGYDGMQGYSLVDYGRECLGLGLAAQKFGASFFGQGSRPSGILIHPNTLSPDAIKNLKASWRDMVEGIDNAAKLAVFEESLKYEQMTITPEEGQHTQTRSFEIRQVANLLGCPPHKLGDDSRTSYNSLEIEQQAYLDECLDPWLVTWEEQCWEKLLSTEEQERDTHFVEFVRDALIRADIGTRYAAHNVALLGGWKNRDEIRATENLNPLPDGIGQEYYQPLNVGIAGEGKSDDTKSQADEPAVPSDTPTPADVERKRQMLLASHRVLLVDAATRAYKRLGTDARRAASRGGNFLEWLDELPTKRRKLIGEMLAPAIDAAAIVAEQDAGETRDKIISTFFDGLHSELLTASGCKPKDLPEAIGEAMTSLEANGAEALASRVIAEVRICEAA